MKRWSIAIAMITLLVGRDAQAECRVLNLPRLDPKPAAEQAWLGDRHGHHREKSAIAWLGRFGKNDNYAEVRALYDADGIDLHIHVADLYVWWLLTDGMQWGGEAVADPLAWDAIEIAIDPSPGDAVPSDGSLRVLVSSYQYNDPVAFPESAVPHLGTRTWQWGNDAWQTVADAQASNVWYHSVASNWNEDPGPNNNTTELDNGTIYTVFIPWSSLGVSEPPSGDVMRMMVRVRDVDDPKDDEVEGDAPSSAGSLEVGALPATTWPDGADDTDTSTWSTLIMHQKPYEPPPVEIEQELVLTPDDVPYRDVTVGGHGFILERWTEGGGSPETFAWETCMDTNLGVRPDLFIHPEGRPTHLCFFARTLLWWDLTGVVPAGNVVTGADLRMYHFGGDTNEDQGTPGFDVATSAVQVHRIEGGWTDTPTASAVTWNKSPRAAENVGFGTITPDTPEGENGKTVSFDLTPLAARAVLRDEPLSVALYGADIGANTGKYMVSQEGGWTPADRPTLTLRYGVPTGDLPSADGCSLGVSAALFDPPGTGAPDAPIEPTPDADEGGGGAGVGGDSAGGKGGGDAGADSADGCSSATSAPAGGSSAVRSFLALGLVAFAARRKARPRWL